MGTIEQIRVLARSSTRARKETHCRFTPEEFSAVGDRSPARLVAVAAWQTGNVLLELDVSVDGARPTKPRPTLAFAM